MHVPFENNVNVTEPLGVPPDPDTVALSVTALPANTDVTAAPFCITSVPVVLDVVVDVTVNGPSHEPEPVVAA